MINYRRRFLVVSAALAFALALAACGDDVATPGAENTTSDTEATTTTTQDSSPPSIDIELTPDAVSGQNLHLTLTDFELSPETPANVFVDGEQTMRLYSDWAHMMLEPGEHQVRVQLIGGEAEASTTINVAASEAMHTHHDPIEVSGEVPEATLTVTESTDGGWDVYSEISNFRFAPEHASGPHVPGEGHLHLYIDGVKVARLYSQWWHIDQLSPGEHEIRIEVNANNHAPYAVGGKTISATTVLTVAGEVTDSAADLVIDVVFADGKMAGTDNRIGVELGQLVQLNVTSDVEEEVHVHGYDLHLDVGSGKEASIVFQANVPGVFEIEFENSGLLLTELEVR